MSRMSQVISLVLIGSSVTYVGYRVWREAIRDKDPNQQQSSAGGGSGSYYHHPWYYGRSSYWGGSGWYSNPVGSTGSKPSSSGAMHSGGFGSSGHAAAGS